MFKETLTLNGKAYVVMLTRKAKIEIERRQKKRSKELANDPFEMDVISDMPNLEKAQKEIESVEKIKDEKEREKRMSKVISKYMPMTIKMSASEIYDDPLTPYEIVYILIHENPNNHQISKEEYEKALFDMEMEIGLIEMERKFKEMYDKVFHDMELINKALNTPKEKPEKAS